MLDSVLDESENQAGCNISLQVSSTDGRYFKHYVSRMNLAMFEQNLTLPLSF